MSRIITHISRFSVLGGEPLAKQNMQDICKLCKEIKDKFPEKKIWLYSGYQYGITVDDDCDGVRNGGFGSTTK